MEVGSERSRRIGGGGLPDEEHPVHEASPAKSLSTREWNALANGVHLGDGRKFPVDIGPDK